MREQFENIPEVHKKLKDLHPTIVWFSDQENEYASSFDGFQSMVIWLNGAWYSYQEQQKKTMTHIFRIPIEQLDEDNDLSSLQAKYSHDFYVGKPLPEGVEVISVEELLRELNEHDPDFYFKTLLSKHSVIK